MSLFDAITTKCSLAPLAAGEVLLNATDCLSISLLPGNKDMCISSPNMPWIPELPHHSPDKIFSYYADGMLGFFEHTKWPQMFDRMEPHTFAVPANPRLLALSNQNFSHAGIPAFTDVDIPWCHFGENDFQLLSHGNEAPIGRLKPHFVERLKNAVDETTTIAEEVAHKAFGQGRSGEVKEAAPFNGLEVDRVDNEEQLHQRRRMFMWDLVNRLNHAVSIMRGHPMSAFDTIMWLREAQRLLLELRGWIIYTKVMRPRSQYSLLDNSHHVQPLRGAITANVRTCSSLYRLGVPVWFIRPTASLTPSTRVVSIRACIQGSTVFSSERNIRCGDRIVPTPSWAQAPIADETSGGLGEQLRRYSLSSKPTIRKLVPVLDAEEHTEGQSNLDSSATSTSSGLHSRGSTCSKPNKSVSSRHPEAPPAKKQKIVHDGVAGLKGPNVHLKPEWAPDYQPSWKAFLSKHPELHVIDVDSRNPFHYAFPPLHAFSSHGITFAKKIHHWLRIRLWCISQIMSPSENWRILMTTMQWRVALEGRYYRIPLPAVPLKPTSSLSDIEQLKFAPDHEDAKCLQVNIKGRLTSELRRKVRRNLDRLDINVRFGVYAGIAPYAEDVTPLPQWASKDVTRQDAETDRTLWAEITWELHAIGFRVEFMRFDQDMLPAVYQNTARTLQREKDIKSMWHGEIIPCWERPCDTAQELGVVDPFSSPLWRHRVASMKILFTLMKTWPPSTFVFPQELNHHDTESDTSFLAWEQDLIAYYCRMFFSRNGRLPTIPLVEPESLHRHMTLTR